MNLNRKLSVTPEYRALFYQSWTNCQINWDDFISFLRNRMTAVDQDIANILDDIPVDTLKKPLNEAIRILLLKDKEEIRKVALQLNSLQVKGYMLDVFVASVLTSVTVFDPDYRIETKIAWSEILNPGKEELKNQLRRLERVMQKDSGF